MFPQHEFYLLLPLTRINTRYSARSFLIVFLPSYAVLDERAALEMAVSELFRQIIERERWSLVGEPGQNIVRNEDHEAPYVTKRNETTRLACVSWGMRDERCNESFKFLVNYFSVSTPSKKKSIDSRSCLQRDHD